MKHILQLSPKLPFPPDDGHKIATWNLSRCLRHNGYSTDLVCFVRDSAVRSTYSAELSRVFESVHPIEKYVERQYPRDLLHALATRTSYFVRKFRTAEFEATLRQLLEDNSYAATIIDGAYMGVYLPVLKEMTERAGRIILRAVNVEYEILERLAGERHNRTYRTILAREARLFRDHELNLVRQVDEVLAITDRDRGILSRESGAPVGMLDPFVDLDEYAPARPEQIEPHSVAFIGNMGWLPNRNGILWFCDAVWPRVLEAFPQARLYVVGKNPPSSIQRLGGSVVVTGYVNDARPYFDRTHLLLVPLTEGSGVRIKIITGLAMGKRVLSTAIGAEGIDYPGLEIRETADEWFQAIRESFVRPPEVDGDASAYARTRYHWRRELTL